MLFQGAFCLPLLFSLITVNCHSHKVNLFLDPFVFDFLKHNDVVSSILLIYLVTVLGLVEGAKYWYLSVLLESS